MYKQQVLHNLFPAITDENGYFDIATWCLMTNKLFLISWLSVVSIHQRTGFFSMMS